MFGIAIANISSLTDEEKNRYRSIYCGLCLELKHRFGLASRASLNYDLAFLDMLYMSLYEPSEVTGKTNCIAHPRKEMPYAISPFTSYCADLSVALAYHKCLDDIADDNSAKAKISRLALEKAYEKVHANLEEQCNVISSALSTISAIEKDAANAGLPALSADAASCAFGELLGFLFETCPECFPDIWSRSLFSLGYELGKFIYLMDAAIDFRADQKAHTYNPFVNIALSEGDMNPDIKMMREVLSVIAERASEVFERLPLVQDVNIMRSILYSGIWQKFNKEYHVQTKQNNANHSLLN